MDHHHHEHHHSPHPHEAHDEEEEAQEGIVLSTAQLDCRLLQGALVVGHVKRKCICAHQPSPFPTHPSHPPTHHPPGEHVLQASWIILKVALFADENQEEEEEEEEEEDGNNHHHQEVRTSSSLHTNHPSTHRISPSPSRQPHNPPINPIPNPNPKPNRPITHPRPCAPSSWTATAPPWSWVDSTGPAYKQQASRLWSKSHRMRGGPLNSTWATWSQRCLGT